MTTRITRIPPHQVGKVLALTYLAIGAFFAVVLLGFALISGEGKGAGAVAELALLYLVLFPVAGYVTSTLFALVYNWAAQRMGGIELVLEDVAAE